MNKTKIVAMVGPNDINKETLKSLIINGVDVFRLSNFSHDFCYNAINLINEVNKELNTYASIMLDIKGPVSHVGKMSSNAFFKKEDKIRIFTDSVIGDNTKFSVNDKEILNDVQINSIIRINEVELNVLDKKPDYLLCKVLKEGYIKENQIVNIPNIKKQYLSNEDKKIIKFAHEMNVDFLSLPYVSSYDDVLEVTDLLIELKNEHIQILTKIETLSAVDNIDRIIRVSDGVIISRTNLGLEVPIERIPGIQKRIINKCHDSNVIGIVAIDLLDVPSRAEVSDIANAVLDGTDAVMFCETLYNFQVEKLKIVEKIIRSAEKDIDYDHMIETTLKTENIDITSSIAFSVASCAEKLKCGAIFAPTMTGYTAKKISKFRTLCPIVAISPSIETVKSLSLNFGVYPILINELNSFDKIIEKSKCIASDFLMLSKKEKIIITGGYPFEQVKHTNFMKIEEL